MNEFHPFIQELIENAEKKMGEEALQEHAEDDEFLLKIIGLEMLAEARGAIAAIAFDVDPLMAHLACELAAIQHYREWLIEKRGVDVRAIEGRTLDAEND